jgi:hypothetical protein
MIDVHIYCYVEAMQNRGKFSKQCVLPTVPRVGEYVDWFNVTEVAYDTAGLVFIFTSNASYGCGPKDGIRLVRRLESYGYTPCSEKEWASARGARHVPQ